MSRRLGAARRTARVDRVGAGDAAPMSRASALVLLVCCASLFMTTLDQTILNIALPALQSHFRASYSGLQWTVDGYILMRASTLFLCGSLGDRFGRRETFQVGLVMFTTGSLACGLAPTLSFLVLARFFQGLGSALLTPASLAIVTTTFSERRRRAWAIGIWSGTTGLSTTAGPVLGGLLVQLFGWRSIFFINIPIGVLALIGSRRLGRSKAAVARPFDIPGQIAIAIGLATVTYALIEGPTAGWRSAAVLALLVASVGAWFAFARIEATSAHALLEPRYLRSPLLLGAGVLAIVSFLCLGAFLFFNTLYLQEVRGYSPLESGLLIIPVTAAQLVFSPWAGKLTGSRGPLLPATAASLCTAAAMAVLAVVSRVDTALWVLMVPYLLLGIGQGLVNPPITNSAVSGMPPDRAGVAGAIAMTGRQIGNNLGVALIGAVIFSVASKMSTSGHAGAATALGTHAGGLDFTAGLRWGYVVETVLALASAAVSVWAFRVRTPTA